LLDRSNARGHGLTEQFATETSSRTDDIVAGSRLSSTVRLLAECLILGSVLGGLQSCAEAKAVSNPSGRIEQVNLGFALDVHGRVSHGCAASSFSLHDPIRMSMEVTEAAAGSVLNVSVRDIATDRIAWRESRPLPHGRSSLTFAIGRDLPVGRYRAESSLGGEATNPRDFVVHDRRAAAR
jgi:hypothetical protein